MSNRNRKKKKPSRPAYTSNGLPKRKMTLREVMINIFWILICMGGFVLFVAGVFWYIPWKENREIKRIKVSNTKTIGTVIEMTGPKNGHAVVEYFVNGKRYELNEVAPSNHTYAGEHYEVIYMKDDPGDSKIDFTAPVFLKDEYTKETNAVVIEIYRNKIGFKYDVGKGDIKRWQCWPEGVEMNLKEGDYCQIEYLVEDPRKARLKF